MRFLLSGSSGFLGGYLSAYLAAQGHDLRRLVRGTAADVTKGEYLWDPAGATIDAAAFDDVDVVVNLSGANLAEHRWSAAYKRELVDSRVQSTGLLARTLVQRVDWAGALSYPYFVSLSGVGWYGHREPDETLTEDSEPGSGFIAELCHDWEAAAQPARDSGIRVLHPRLGVVVGNGSMLGKLAPLFRRGLGARLGSGTQVLSWIALDDLGSALLHCIEQRLTGAVNFTSPNPLTNAEFTRLLADEVNRPALAVAPAPVLRMGLGEMADELLTGQRVIPQRLLESGYVFTLPHMRDALARYVPQV